MEGEGISKKKQLIYREGIGWEKLSKKYRGAAPTVSKFMSKVLQLNKVNNAVFLQRRRRHSLQTYPIKMYNMSQHVAID